MHIPCLLTPHLSPAPGPPDSQAQALSSNLAPSPGLIYLHCLGGNEELGLRGLRMEPLPSWPFLRASLRTSRWVGRSPSGAVCSSWGRTESSAGHMEGLGAQLLPHCHTAPLALGPTCLPLPLGWRICHSFIRLSLWPCHPGPPRLLCTPRRAMGSEGQSAALAPPAPAPPSSASFHPACSPRLCH